MIRHCDVHGEFRDNCLTCVLLNLLTISLVDLEKEQSIERELYLNLAEVA
jgi:hypothetical protein